MIKNYYINMKQKIITYIVSTGNSDTLVPNFFLTKKEQKWLLRTIIRVMKKFPDYKLIIKGRTGYDMNYLGEQIAKEEAFTNFEIIVKTNNYKLLKNSDLIILQNSDMGYQALLLNKPVIVLEIKHMIKHSYFNDFIKHGVVKRVFDEEGLEREIRNLIEPKIILLKEMK